MVGNIKIEKLLMFLYFSAASSILNLNKHKHDALRKLPEKDDFLFFYFLLAGCIFPGIFYLRKATSRENKKCAERVSTFIWAFQKCLYYYVLWLFLNSRRTFWMLLKRTSRTFRHIPFLSTYLSIFYTVPKTSSQFAYLG